MRKFDRLQAVAAPLPLANVDTDQILAARFLKTISREGLGRALFHAMRFDAHGRENPEFILNREPWRSAGILIALDNFGCGSSREHAPWALADFGIRAIVAPGFADIFHGNCFKNGILPIALPRPEVDILMADAADPATACMTIDLFAQTLRRTNGRVISFRIAPERKRALLLGLDEIAETARLMDRIEAFEASIEYCSPPIPLEPAARVGDPRRDLDASRTS